MNETAIAEATKAWLASYHWLTRDTKTGGSKQCYEGPSADEVLAKHGVTMADPPRYHKYERAIRERAYKTVGVRRKRALPNPKRRSTEADKDAILEMFRAGRTRTQIARTVGFSYDFVSTYIRSVVGKDVNRGALR